MQLPKRQRICLVFKSKFHSAKPELTLDTWKSFWNQIGKVQYDKILGENQEKLSDQKLPFNCKNGDELSEKIHAKLDTLPNHGPHEYLLDLVWITDGLPKKFADLYGALKRSVEWHGASIFIICNDDKLENPNWKKYAKQLQAQVLPIQDCPLEVNLNANLYWKGSMCIFDEEALKFQNIGLKTQQFELNWTEEPEEDVLKNVHFSQRIKVIEKCALSTIPPCYFTDSKFTLKLKSNDDILKDFFQDENMFENGNCLVAKLERHETKKSMNFRMQKSNGRTTDQWKKAVLANNYKWPLDQDWNGKALLSTYLVIVQDTFNKKKEEKLCIILNPDAPLAAMAKSYEVVKTNFESPVDVINETTVEVIENPPEWSDLQDFIDEATEEVIAEMKKRNPDKVFDEAELQKNALDIVRKHVQDQLTVTTVQVLDPKQCAACNSKVPTKFESDHSDLLNFVKFQKEKEKDQKETKTSRETSTMMTPSGDYVVLEAKEMLKHFNPQGLPAQTKSLENVSFQAKNIKKMTVDKLKCQNWPEVLLTEFHDLYYNKSESSEKDDATIAKIQQMYIGSRETASTCHGLNSQQTVLVSKPKVTSSKVDKKSTTVLRRTPRKSAQGSSTGKNLAQLKALENRLVTKTNLTAPKNPEEIFR